MVLTRIEENTRLKRELTRDAIALALRGDWEQAAQVNRTLLALFADEVDAMNRLGKALMELGRYSEAGEVLDRVIRIAPHNTIAKKNLARLTCLQKAPAPSKQARRTWSAPQLFIEESGKSGTTMLQKLASDQVVARIGPGDPVNLVVAPNAITVFTKEDEYLGQIEPKLGRRLVRLINGGNRYDAAVVGVSDRGISLIMREVYRHPNLHDVCSFPSKSKEEHRVYLSGSLLRYIEERDLEEDDEEGSVIDEAELDSEWSE